MKIILTVILLSFVLIGCTPATYETTSNITFENIIPEPRTELHITKLHNNITFEVYHNGDIIELDGYTFRNEDTYETLPNYGDWETLTFLDVEEGFYTFAGYKNGRSFVYQIDTLEIIDNVIIQLN